MSPVSFPLTDLLEASVKREFLRSVLKNIHECDEYLYHVSQGPLSKIPNEADVQRSPPATYIGKVENGDPAKRMSAIATSYKNGKGKHDLGRSIHLNLIPNYRSLHVTIFPIDQNLKVSEIEAELQYWTTKHHNCRHIVRRAINEYKMGLSVTAREVVQLMKASGKYNEFQMNSIEWACSEAYSNSKEWTLEDEDSDEIVIPRKYTPKNPPENITEDSQLTPDNFVRSCQYRIWHAMSDYYEETKKIPDVVTILRLSGYNGRIESSGPYSISSKSKKKVYENVDRNYENPEKEKPQFEHIKTLEDFLK